MKHDPGLDFRPLDGRRVVVAMSGGVDSSCAAALLVEAGCEVVGVTLQLYDHGAATGSPKRIASARVPAFSRPPSGNRRKPSCARVVANRK